MKKVIRKMVLLQVFILVLGLSTRSHAQVYTPGASLATPSWFEEADAELGCWFYVGDEALGSAIGLAIDYSEPFDPVLKTRYDWIDLGFTGSWYETTENTIIDAAFISSAAPFFPDGEIHLIPNTPFLMAFSVGDYEYYGGHAYGWAELMWNGADLLLLDSAAEHGNKGIIAGTYQAVPEPSSAILIACIGGLGVFVRRVFPAV